MHLGKADSCTKAIDNPNPSRIPDNFVYYNPQVERNAIIVTSHKHDYSNFKTVDLEATSTGDIKSTHIGKDLIESGEPRIMRYFVNQDEHILRRQIRTKFDDIRVDMDAIEIPLDQLRAVLEILRRERSLTIDTPTPMRSGPIQASMFGSMREEQDETE